MSFSDSIKLLGNSLFLLKLFPQPFPRRQLPDDLVSLLLTCVVLTTHQLIKLRLVERQNSVALVFA